MNKNEVFIYVPKFLEYMSGNPAEMLNAVGIALRETGHPEDVWEPLLGPTPSDFQHLDQDERAKFTRELLPLLRELPPIPAHEVREALDGRRFYLGKIPVDFHKYMADRIRAAAAAESPSEIINEMELMKKIEFNARQFIISGGAYRMTGLTNHLNMIYLYSLMGGKYLEKKKEKTESAIRALYELFLETVTFEQWHFIVSSYDI
jgi:hypothetical protein